MEQLTLHVFLISLLGASVQEVLHWYNLRLSLGKKFEHSNPNLYWAITIVSILFFALTNIFIVELVQFSENVNENSKIFITAMLYPIIIKKILKTITLTFNGGISPADRVQNKINTKTYLTNF